MRDPKRIPEILEKLRVIWERVPDWRLGQLINNVTYVSSVPAFYVEDEELIKDLDALSKIHEKEEQYE